MNEKVDLESAIMAVYQTSSDIELLFKRYLISPVILTEDEMSNALLGIKVLHDLRMDDLMDTYCQKFELNQHCTDSEIIETREAIVKQLKKKAENE